MNKNVEYAVVGTGPSGVASAAALIAKGIKPTFIEAGELTNGVVLNAANLPKSGTSFSSKLPANPGQKAWFGSYDAYAQDYPGGSKFESNLNVRASNSIGGFSRVWGATFDFWKEDSRWPMDAFPEKGDFDAIRDLVPHVTTQFESGSGESITFGASQSSLKIFERLRLQSNKLVPTLTPSTLAVSVTGKSACVLCAKCLDGCPRDSIWFAGDHLQKWLFEGKANLITGVKVSEIRETNDAVELHCISKNGDKTIIQAKRVYLAAGAIGSAEIALKSGIVDEVQINDTSTIFTAAIGFMRQKPGLPGHSLSQFWLKWAGSSPLAAQVYAPNESNLHRLLMRFPFLSPLGALFTPLVLRMHPVIAYLDSNSSPQIAMRMAGGEIQIFETTNKRYLKARSRAIRKIRQALSLAGLFVPPVGTDFSSAGTGYHHGSSFPLGETSDILGRIKGWESVHIVDSSVLPYLSVGSITPTVMANAYRITRCTLE